VTGITVAVALGSNLGDRRAHLEFAASKLRTLLRDLRLSQFVETVPAGVPGQQRLYLNAAAVGETTMSARELLDLLLAVERERGRERPFQGAPRTLDLDLVLFGDRVIRDPDLSVPHPRFRERLFVLEPLAEIAPDLKDPVTGKAVRELLSALEGSERERRTP
jgi:2-amino-4-hydroxy-6-hydroxymethyldihydropteridine diphosphokinase